MQPKSETEPSLLIPMKQLGFGYDIELKPWSNGLSGYRVFDNGDLELIEGGLGFSLDMLESCEGYEGWKRTVPRHVYQAAKDYAEHHYIMLRLVANFSQALDLINSRPVLLALICEHYGHCFESASQVVKLGQRDILSKLSLSNSKAALKFIDKAQYDVKLATSLRFIKILLDQRNERHLRFRHYERVTYNVALLDQVFPFLTGTKLGRSLVNESLGSKHSLSAYFQDTLELARIVGIGDPIATIERLDSLGQLQALHDRWTDMRQQMLSSRYKPMNTDTVYQQPLALADDIDAIVDYDDLCKEGEELAHCIAIYHNRIVSGHYFVYRFNGSERMTVGIRAANGKRFPFEIDQISGYRNQRPSECTRQLVQAWFEQNRQDYFNQMHQRA